MSEPVRALPPEPPQGQPQSQRALRLVAMREHSLLSLIELSREISAALDERSLADLTLLNLMGHMGCRSAALWLAAAAPGEPPRLAGCHGLAQDACEALGPKLEAHFVMDEDDAAPFLVSDGADDLAPRFRARLVELGIEVVAPLVSPQGRLGVVALGSRPSGERYSDFDLGVLSTSLGMVGFALETSRLYRDVQATNTELAEANLELRKADQLKSEFIQNVNHELRTPIAIILGSMDCLLRAPDIDVSHRPFMEAVVKQGDKLLSMIQTLLEFSPEAGEAGRLPVQPFGVRQWLTPILNAHAASFEAGGRHLAMRMSDEAQGIVGHEQRLAAVLAEILGNALKFTPPGTHVVVCTSELAGPEAGRLAIDIEDDGPGVAPELRADLFTPFRQGDGSSTRAAGGLGMGLAAARRTVERMGGTLTLLEREGPGCTFRIQMPAA